MEYERLTKRNANGEVETVKRPKSSYIQEVYEEWDEINRELKLRLAELEDKIEAGTLVTVPYAIGQELYCVSKSGYFDVEKVKVSLISIRQNGDIDIRLNYYTENGDYWSCFKYDAKYYELFDNEEEAEKRLEELQK
nr:MAG TPA: hypothetical protein [Caudoviricetes sp.]